MVTNNDVHQLTLAATISRAGDCLARPGIVLSCDDISRISLRTAGEAFFAAQAATTCIIQNS
ncbi:MAG TPA: hypothetical protein DCE44_09495 [Verrucomicrobiales bacterium]|nr:hypothetical protein [Verrucomicrobiales bacterium]